MAGGCSVLVVDDDAVVHLIASQILTPVGFAVAHAEDGVVALHRLGEAHFDLVVLDMLMPNKEGIETLLEIRRRWPRIRVVAISGGGRIDAAELLDWARVAGAHATLAKPLERTRLLQAAAEALTADPLARAG